MHAPLRPRTFPERPPPSFESFLGEDPSSAAFVGGGIVSAPPTVLGLGRGAAGVLALLRAPVPRLGPPG